MNLLVILQRLDQGKLDETTAAQALAKHLDPILIATALIEIRKQRNIWHKRYNAQKE